MPKLNIVWKIKTHHVRKYANGRHSGFRLKYTGQGRSYRVLDSEVIIESVTFESAKAHCLSDLAQAKGEQKFLYKLAPTPTHEVIEDGKVKAG